VGDVQGFAVDPAHRSDVQDRGSRRDPQDRGDRHGSREEGEVGNLAAYRGARLGQRGTGVPEGAQGEPLVVCRASEEPARPVPRRDQALVAQGLQGAANRRPGHPIAGAELGLGLQGAVRADVAQGDPLAQVVGDGSEPRTCH
jgi:hypothetical protein